MLVIFSGCITVKKSQIQRERSNYHKLVEKEKNNKYPKLLNWSKK